MKIPDAGPTLNELASDDDVRSKLPQLIGNGTGPEVDGEYYHWDKLRHLDPPDGLTTRQWWFGIKIARQPLLKSVPLVDKDGRPFRYAMPDSVLRRVHEIDRNASGRIEISEQVTNPETRDRYLVNSLMQEAITSSQLEGAMTTVERAKEMIRSGREPRDKSEQMVLNNFRAMQHLREFVDEPLTREMLLELQEIVTHKTLDGPDAAGRFRTPGDDIAVTDIDGQVLHMPPDADELPERVQRLCDFANEPPDSDEFLHPVVRAIILHFWLGYDHPFVDGNGRTARALFYWAMLSHGYWLCEYISISRILNNAPAQYARSFLYSETDANDLTYFIDYQLNVIQRAIDDLHEYLRKKVREVREVESLIHDSAILNHRELALLSHALRHPDSRYTIKSHKRSHGVVYQTARTDLLHLVDLDLLKKRKIGRQYYFMPYDDLADRLRELEATD